VKELLLQDGLRLRAGLHGDPQEGVLQRLDSPRVGVPVDRVQEFGQTSLAQVRVLEILFDLPGVLERLQGRRDLPPALPLQRAVQDLHADGCGQAGHRSISSRGRCAQHTGQNFWGVFSNGSHEVPQPALSDGKLKTRGLLNFLSHKTALLRPIVVVAERADT
jgi:hypothetical protein